MNEAIPSGPSRNQGNGLKSGDVSSLRDDAVQEILKVWAVRGLSDPDGPPPHQAPGEAPLVEPARLESRGSRPSGKVDPMVDALRRLNREQADHFLELLDELKRLGVSDEQRKEFIEHFMLSLPPDPSQQP